MTETLATLLWRLSEGGTPAIFPGCLAADHLGPEFDGLLNRRIVVELARVTEWSICEACECDLSARPIQTIGDRLIASCPLNSARDAALKPDDTRQFEINIPRLVVETANQSGFNSPELVENDVWLLGATPHGAVFAAPSAASWHIPGLVQRLRAWAHGSVMLVVGAACPESERQRMAEAGVHGFAIREILCQEPGQAFAMDQSRLLPSIGIAARLVLDRGGKAAALDGIGCPLSPHSVALLSLLAERAVAGAPVVPPSDIEKVLWPATAGRMRTAATAEAIRDLRRQMEKCWGEKMPSGGLVVTRPGQGYQLDLPLQEIRVIS